ncbi:MAG: NUDIX domain-containing protein [Okeania sp. SIO3B3]|nr:NUDIX domain-containing protein [Okeania sp. SIO3B3]
MCGRICGRLLIREAKQSRGWYFPAGKVDPDEHIFDAAHRETLEEAGVPIELDGIIRLEFTPREHGTAFVRIILVAHPIDDTPPKNYADENSLGAQWVTLEQAAQLHLRHPEVVELFQYVADGRPIWPLTILATEHTPFI